MYLLELRFPFLSFSFSFPFTRQGASELLTRKKPDLQYFMSSCLLYSYISTSPIGIREAAGCMYSSST